MKVFQALAVLMLIGASTPGGFAASGPPEQVPSDAARSSAAAKAATLPKDVYPDSLNRLPLIKREDLDETRKKIYDSIVSGRYARRAGFQGPPGIKLHTRHEAELTISSLGSTPDPGERLLELGVLVTAREMNSGSTNWSGSLPRCSC